MYKHVLYVSLVLCFVCNISAAKKAQVINNTNTPIDNFLQKIGVVNDADESLELNLEVPEYARADIEITKINDLQGALHKAILNDSAVEIKSAVQAGADVNKEKNGKSPLLFAILLSRYNAIEALLNFGAMPDDVCGQHAIKMKDGRSLLLLVKHGCINLNLKEVAGMITHFAINRQHQLALELIKELVNCGYNVNELWDAAICLAYFGPSEGEAAVKFLLFRGANPNHINTGYRGDIHTPLWSAAANFPNKRIVKILIKSGTDINQKIKPNPKDNSSAVLSFVLKRGDDTKRKEVIEVLLEHGANL